MAEYVSIVNSKVSLSDPEHKRFFFDQYKLFVDSVNKLAQRRKDANTLYVTINSLILSTVGAVGEGKIFPEKNLLLVGILIVIGIGSVISWISVMSLYKTVDYENYCILKEFEGYFPSNVYTRFNQHIAKENTPNNDKSFLIRKERVIPYLFLVGYSLFIVLNLYRVYMKI